MAYFALEKKPLGNFIVQRKNMDNSEARNNNPGIGKKCDQDGANFLTISSLFEDGMLS